MEYMYPKSNPKLTEIQDELAEFGETKTVKFVWTPGHAGIDGNEKADAADEGAKEDLRKCLPQQSMVVAADHQSKIQRKKNYRTSLETIRQPHDSFKKTIERLWKPNVNFIRHQQVVLSRMRMCHTHFTHSHHMTREGSPMCDQYSTTLQRQSHIFYSNVLNFNQNILNIRLTKPAWKITTKKSSGF
jgi:hypothetical protein